MSSTILGMFTSFLPGPRLIDGSDLINQANQLFSTSAGLTAYSGGGQTNALVLTAALNQVTTVAVANDSVMLPLALPGSRVSISNEGANSLQVFGQPTNSFNGGVGDVIVAAASSTPAATGTGVAQGNGVAAIYTCMKVGRWKQMISA